MLILNFHHVEKTIQHPARKHISITPDGLRRLIRTLRSLGREVVSLRDVLDAPESLDKRRHQVILTFDDGYVNNLEQAGPVLAEERCPATVFALAGCFGGTNTWDQGNLPEAERDRLMTMDQMQTLADSGYVTFGSHGLYHRDLTTLPGDELDEEIQRSYQILSDGLGNAFLPVFAYPWGRYDATTLLSLAQSPYRYAFTVERAAWSVSHAPFEIPRYSAYYRDGNPVVFLAKLARHGQLLAS